MQNLITFLFLICFICVIIGFINPKFVIRWGDYERKTRKNVLKYYGTGTIITFLLVGMLGPRVETTKVNKSEMSQETSKEVAQEINDVEEKKEPEETNTEDNIQEDTIETSELYEKVFVIFSDKIGKSTFENDKSVIDSTGYTAEITNPNEVDLGKIVIKDNSGDYVTLMYYPNKDKIETLALLAYNKNRAEISIKDEMHTTKINYNTYNIDANPRNKLVSGLNDLKKFMFVDMKDVKSNIATEEIDVYINVSTSIDDGKASFSIDSNLPDDTKLMLTLSDGNQYRGQTNVTIKSGQCQSDLFSNKGEKLSGEYSLEISMPIASVQPDTVRKLIGNSGENLRGDLVVPNSIGNGQTVEKTIDISI